MKSFNDVNAFVLKSFIDYFFQDISRQIRCDGEDLLVQIYIDKVNHELRTPITCIHTAMELLKRNSNLSENEKIKIFQLIEKNIERLIKAIDILFKV